MGWVCAAIASSSVHPRESGDPGAENAAKDWVPAFAGTNGARGDSRSSHLALAAALRPHGPLLRSAHDLAHALVFELLDSFSFEGFGRVDVALRVDGDAVHAVELAGLAPAAAE